MNLSSTAKGVEPSRPFIVRTGVGETSGVAEGCGRGYGVTSLVPVGKEAKT